jgi:ubiquinone/menaquinone biosynthesis C-methylase UbiE
MNEQQAAQYWNENAIAWTTMARAGFDMYRDHLNTPAFFDILPDVKGLCGIDIGCGEGYNTRLLAQKGVRLKAIDISPVFIEKATETENDCPLGIEYRVASATQLPFVNASVDFAVSFMCLMDIPDPAKALQEAYRVLKPGGFFQFSIIHPCFNTPHRKNLRNLHGETYAIEVGDYFKNRNGKIEEWTFGAAPPDLKNKFPKFKVPIFNITLTQWFNAISAAGFRIEQINEPCPSNETVLKYPYLQDAGVVAYFLHIRCRK